MGQTRGVLASVFGRGRALEDEHRRDAGADQEDLPHRASVGPAAVKAGDQVGHGDIEKAGCREGEKVGKHARREFEGEDTPRRRPARWLRQTGH